MPSWIKSIATASLLSMTSISAATAAEFTSAYTDLNLDDCLVLDADDFGASFSCPGYKGFPLWVAEGDLRFFVSFGFGAPDQRAAEQTLPGFNTINTTLEWRLTNETGDWKPFASILRYYMSNGDGETDSQILIVTKIEDNNTCHIAYVDATITKDANEIARLWADNTAKGFECATDDAAYYPE